MPGSDNLGRGIARRGMVLLPLLLTLAGCGGRDTANAPPTGAAKTSVQATADAGKPLTGRQTFVIVPEQSKASYLASEEFFAGALKKLGIAAGRNKVVGTTQAIEGQFQFNPDKPTDASGKNTFAVRMNTFTTDQPMRDKWIRENGPRFNDFPLATFTTTAIESGPSAYRAGEEFTFKLAGDVTIREVTKPVTFNVKVRLAGDTLAGAATTRLLMSDFGIEQLSFANTLTVADAFGIDVQFTARAQTK